MALPVNCLLYYIAHTSSSDQANQLNNNMLSTNESCYDRAADLKAFDETKAGVKGLVDAGISTIPPFFIHSPKPDPSSSLDPAPKPKFGIPVIDLSGVGKDPESHTDIMNRIRVASETWGFFQVVNHGISQEILEAMRKEEMKVFREPFYKKKGDKCMNLSLSPGSYRWGTPSATCLGQLSWSEAFHIPLTDISSDCGSPKLRYVLVGSCSLRSLSCYLF